MTHCNVGRSVSKRSAMAGRAITTLPWSTTELNVPNAMAAKARYLYLGLRIKAERKGNHLARHWRLTIARPCADDCWHRCDAFGLACLITEAIRQRVNFSLVGAGNS